MALHIGLGILGLLIGCCMGAFIFAQIAPPLSPGPAKPNEYPVLTFFALFMLAWAIAGAFIGWGLA